MSTETLNSQKLDLISWITELEDENILNQIKKIQEENISIPQWQQEEVLNRLNESKEEDYVAWEKYKRK